MIRTIKFVYCAYTTHCDLKGGDTAVDILKGCWEAIVSRKWGILRWLSFLLVIGYGVILIHSGDLSDLSSKIGYFGFAFTVFSIVAASVQYGAIHDWNRRQFSMVALREERASQNKHMKVLDTTFSYVHRKKENPISVDDIHKRICKKDEKGALIVDVQGRMELSEDEEERAVYHAINHLLSSSEYIAVGINQGIFDEDVVRAFWEGRIIKAYYVFRHYIEHVNDMRRERKGKIWEHLEAVAKNFEGDGKKTVCKRPPAG